MGILQRWRGTSGLPRAPVHHHTIISWGKDRVQTSVVALAEGTAELVGVAATPLQGIRPSGHPDLDRWAALCEATLTRAEEMTKSSCGHKVVPDYVTMSVPPEITRSLSIVASSTRRNPSRGVTLDESRSLLRRGYRQAQDTIRVGEASASEDFIFGSVAEIGLDGQVVADPSGLRGEQLRLRMTFALAPLEWIRALEIVAERLELELTAVIPEHVGYASALSEPKALLILLGDHHTCVCMVRNGRLQWSALADTGERQIVGAVAASLDLHGSQADALMRAYRVRQLQSSVELRVARAFWEELRRWMTALAEAIRSAAGDEPMPHVIYFLDSTRRIREALQSLETPFWERGLPFERCPEIVPLDIDTVRNVLDSTAQAGDPEYLPLRGLARYVAELFAPGNDLERAVVANVHSRRHASAAKSR